jgi:hypothetical protein
VRIAHTAVDHLTTEVLRYPAANASTTESSMILEKPVYPATAHTRDSGDHCCHIGSSVGTRWKARFTAAPLLAPCASTSVLRSTWAEPASAYQTWLLLLLRQP